ncbi:MAG: hypothetical protein IT323_00180, partial [Anaerolineae bacterium]|nr:hypothetical protein [Anaerolineae bacterium]
MTITPPAPHHACRAALAAILLAAYLLLYVNTPAEADGKAILAVASSLALHGRADMNAAAASDDILPPLARLGSVGVDGALYAKKGPTPSLALAPLVWLADRLPGLPIRATAMLFNALVTAAAALLLFTFVRWLGFRPESALIIGLIYGLATLAAVYVKTLFGEPLAALLLLIAVMAGWRYRQRGGRSALILCGAALVAMAGINTVYVVYTPVLALYVFWGRRRVWDVARFAAPFVAGAGLLALYNWARFGGPLETGYHFAEGEGFIHPLGAGLFGLLLSPYRGLLPYNPVLLLAIPGAVLFWRRHGRLAGVIAALTAAQAVALASWWSWHGGILWGTRFMLPVLPLAVLLIAPLVEESWRRRWLKLPIAALAVISCGVQLLGGLYSYFPYIGYLYAGHSVPGYTSLASGLADEVVYRADLSPILGHLAMALNGWPLEPAWAAQGDALHVVAALALALGGVVALILPRRAARLLVATAGIAALGLVAARQPEAPDVAALRTALDPPGALLAATDRFGDALLDLGSRFQVITMNAPSDPHDEQVRARWQYARSQGPYLWLVSWFPPADPANWQERALWQEAAFVRETPVSGHRATLFWLGDLPDLDRPGGWQFGGSIRLEDYGVRRESGGLAVRLRWSVANAPACDCTWFVHLLDANGQIVAQQDRAPLGGYAPVRAWSAGDSVDDRLFFPLEPGQDVAGGWLRLGWIMPGQSAPLPVTGPRGALLADPFVVVPI